jgi:hypothetical protein
VIEWAIFLWKAIVSLIKPSDLSKLGFSSNAQVLANFVFICFFFPFRFYVLISIFVLFSLCFGFVVVFLVEASFGSRTLLRG